MLVLRVFVAGASGVIGVRLVPQLVVAAHEVAGMTHSPAKVELLRGLGAEAVVCDAFDGHALREAVRAFQPEAVVNELTDLPDQPAATNDANARMRREAHATCSPPRRSGERHASSPRALPGSYRATLVRPPSTGSCSRPTESFSGTGACTAPAPISRSHRAFMSTRPLAVPCRHLTRPLGPSTSQTISSVTKDVERRFLDPGFDHGTAYPARYSVRFVRDEASPAA